jgi:fibronectin type 3 domain-containing protein
MKLFIKSISKQLGSVLILIIIVTNNLFAQNSDEPLKFKVGLTARSYGDSVYLRWAVTNPIAWRLVKENGFIIEKAKILSDGKTEKYSKVSEQPIKPWPMEKWEEYFDTRPPRDVSSLDNEGVAFTLGIGEKDDEANINLPPENEDYLKSIKEKRSSQEWALLLSLTAANNSLIAAEGLGLFYVDKDVKENETYSYRIYCNYKSNLYSFDTTYLKIKNEKFDPKKSLKTITANENDGSIEIIWDTDIQFSTFNVERSEDKQTYKRLNDAPLLTLKSTASDSLNKDSFIDTTIINYKPYNYRVYANTVFADEVLLGEITAMGKDRTPPEQPFVLQPTHIDENKVKISWQMADPPANDLAGFYVGRDSVSDGSFNYIHKSPLPKNIREFIDTSFSKNNYNFYTVFAFDTAGNFSSSYPVYVVLNDTVPPIPPKWKEAFMDSNGIVTLRLEPNKEFDLMGYRILKANAPDHEFSSIIESFDPDSVELKFKVEFQDSVDLQSTTKYVYYRATALDNRYNESGLSEIIAVPRPDVVPPVAPVLTDAFVSEKDVTLKFIPSESEDVKNHYVLRRKSEEEKWDTIAVLKPKDSVYVDTKVSQNVLYQYCLFAVDSSNLKSDLSFVLEARPYFTGVLPDIKNFNVSFVSEKKSAVLKWDYDKLENIYFVIYRAYENQPLVRYKTIKLSDSRIFSDSDFSNGSGKYFYAVKAFDNLNAESRLSEKGEVLVK